MQPGGPIVPVLHRPAPGRQGVDVAGLYLNPPGERGRAVRGQKEQIQTLDRTALDPAAAARAGRTPLPRLHPARHLDPVRRPGHRHRPTSPPRASRGTGTRSSWHSCARSPASTPRRTEGAARGDGQPQAHKHPAVKAWLAANPRVLVHVTPTRTSWMNLVEVCSPSANSRPSTAAPSAPSATSTPSRSRESTRTRTVAHSASTSRRRGGCKNPCALCAGYGQSAHMTTIADDLVPDESWARWSHLPAGPPGRPSAAGTHHLRLCAPSRDRSKVIARIGGCRDPLLRDNSQMSIDRKSVLPPGVDGVEIKVTLGAAMVERGRQAFADRPRAGRTAEHLVRRAPGGTERLR